MSSKAGWSSACKSGHHDRCTGHRKTGKKRKKCACPCHMTAKQAAELVVKGKQIIQGISNIVDNPRLKGAIPQELATIIKGQPTNPYLGPVYAAEVHPIPEQPTVRHAAPMITPPTPAGFLTPPELLGLKRDPDAVICYNCGTLVTPPHHTCPGCARDVRSAAAGSDHPDPDLPACFGECAEISATCDGCQVYNECRRATYGSR